MNISWTPEEFQQLAKPWDDKTRAIINERLNTNFGRAALEVFTKEEAITMKAMIGRLIPHQEGIDLVGYMDWAAPLPLGRGDKAPDAPGEPELYKIGLQKLEESCLLRHDTRFADTGPQHQDQLITDMQKGELEWEGLKSDYFFERFYGKLLNGYFAHPRVWMRIGFMGPAYPEGYAWLNRPQVKARHEREPGWDRL